MINSQIRRFLSIGLVVLVSTTGIAWEVPAFADNHCDKNDDKNCNHSEKNQKSTPKVECDIDAEVTDHNKKNTDLGPVDLQCNRDSSNIRDSTVIQNPPSNGDFESLKVVSSDPSDGENDVPVDLSQIKVTFNKKIDKNGVDTESLALFANNCGTDFCNDPNIQDVSVSGKSVTFTIDNNDRFSPNTNYIASLLSSIKGEDGNFLDCANSKGVDDNCEWEFKTSGTALNPVITLDPTSGPVDTLVTVTGNGFDPASSVVITFDGTNVATATSTSDGGFSAAFNVPLATSNGDHTVRAIQESNSASKTFTVTSSEVPTIILNPTSGPVGASVNISGAGFDPVSTVVIAFNDTDITTVTTTANGLFFANFTVPPSSIGPAPVIATQGSNSASKTFTVTSILLPTSRSNVDLDSLSENRNIPDVFSSTR